MLLGSRIANVLGFQVTFIEENRNFDGVSLGGEAFVSSSTEHSEVGLIGHEVSHSFEKTDLMRIRRWAIKGDSESFQSASIGRNNAVDTGLAIRQTLDARLPAVTPRAYNEKELANARNAIADINPQLDRAGVARAQVLSNVPTPATILG